MRLMNSLRVLPSLYMRFNRKEFALRSIAVAIFVLVVSLGSAAEACVINGKTVSKNLRCPKKCVLNDHRINYSNENCPKGSTEKVLSAGTVSRLDMNARYH
jgi:hypothetical protein